MSEAYLIKMYNINIIKIIYDYYILKLAFGDTVLWWKSAVLAQCCVIIGFRKFKSKWGNTAIVAVARGNFDKFNPQK